MILEDKFLSQCVSDIKIKLRQLQQQVSAASLEEVVQTATNTFYNIEKKREAKAQKRERRKEISHTQMLAALLANPESLKNEARDKCLICSQVGHWTKECPNYGTPPKTACYKCHQLGYLEALCCGDPSLNVKCQAFPHSGSICSSQPTCHR